MYGIDPNIDFSPLIGLSLDHSKFIRHYGEIYSDGLYICVEYKWGIREPSGDWRTANIHDEGPGPETGIHHIMNTPVKNVVADKTGGLIIEFENGAALRLDENPKYESYKVTAPDFFLLV